jgi:hypothetical protein
MAIFDDTKSRQANKLHRLDEDFSKAMQNAFMEELMGLFRRKSRRLLPFAKVKEDLEISLATDRGIQTVPLDAIVGSEGRYKSFTRQFLPLKEDLRERWKKVNAAHYERKNLGPVELYKVTDAYFVKDGHHRVSVARTRGVGYIEARVFEYACDVPLDKNTDLDKLAIQQNYHHFLKETRLQKHYPDADLQLTLLGGYTILMEHIQVHQYYLEQKNAASVTIEQAALSWYDRVYLPIFAILRSHQMMRRFPHRTETDFYIWVVLNRRLLIKEFVPDNEAKEMVEAYAQKYNYSLRPFIGALMRFLKLVKYR